MAKKKELTGLVFKDVVSLGGTKEDIEFLKNVDLEEASDLEFEVSVEDGEDDYNMVRDYLEAIGLHGKTEKSKPKKIKARVDASLGIIGNKESNSVEKKLLKVSNKDHKKLLFSLNTDQSWFDQADSELASGPWSQVVLDHVTRLGEELMTSEVQHYEKAREKSRGSSEVRWLRGVMIKGTLSDKMASLTLLVQESPVHSLSAISSLLAMASKKGKRECILAIESLKDLWLTDLLPENRKLKSLNQRPLGMLVDGSLDHHDRSKKLLLWYFEDQVKIKFVKYLTILMTLSHDPVFNIREKMLGVVFDLLYRRPEGEKELLSQVVNKLGDPVKKVASKASFFLLKFVDHHVHMKPTVADEVDKLLRRSNVGHKAQYYGVCTLNQFSIPHGDTPLASKLISIYFTFFKSYVGKDDFDGKMLSALLTGVNRTFPFIQGELPGLDDHLQSLFRIVHVGPLATGIQSLMLLYHVMESQQGVSSRYYQALYTKLLDPRLKHSGKQALFLNLLFKSIKVDPELGRVKAFLKRILQVCAGHAPPFVCGCLIMLSEILKLRQNLWAFILQSEYSDEENTETESGRSSSYDPASRNPLYCRAETSCLWELTLLQTHHHPSVQTFAKKIAAGQHLEYHGDPLLDFALMRFLDRFVCKNPKQKFSDHGGSLMQRSSVLVKDHLKENLDFSSAGKTKVREEELFMYKYFIEKAEMEAKMKKKKKKRKKKDGEDASEGSEVEEGGSEKGEADVKQQMDFAGELKMVKSQTKKNKPKRDGSHEGDSSEDEFSKAGDFSDIEMGSDMEGRDSDEDSLVGGYGGGGRVDTSEAHMEKLLLQNLTSSEDEDSEVEMDEPPRKRKRGEAKMQRDLDPSSMFAAAEEFAHLLEDQGTPAEEKYAEHQARQPGWPKKRSSNNSQPRRKNSSPPGKNSSQPRRYSSQPRRNSSQPGKNSSQPRRYSSQPRRNSSQPRKNSSQPRKNSSQPRKNSSHPRKNSSHPRKNSSQPRKNKTSSSSLPTSAKNRKFKGTQKKRHSGQRRR